MTTSPLRFVCVLAFSCVGLVASAWAGRPSTVDDANTNEPGRGHVELWFAGDNARARAWNIAPAFAPIENLELSALVTRDTSNSLTSYAGQVKWVITPAQKSGCNVGMVLGVSKTRTISGETPYANALVTCNGSWDAAHVNVGANRPTGGGSTYGAWGVALEREFGAVTAHVEAFGERGSKAAVQIGARTEIAPKLQLDGTIGARGGRTLYSAGVKLQF